MAGSLTNGKIESATSGVQKWHCLVWLWNIGQSCERPFQGHSFLQRSETQIRRMRFYDTNKVKSKYFWDAVNATLSKVELRWSYRGRTLDKLVNGRRFPLEIWTAYWSNRSKQVYFFLESFFFFLSFFLSFFLPSGNFSSNRWVKSSSEFANPLYR